MLSTLFGLVLLANQNPQLDHDHTIRKPLPIDQRECVKLYPGINSDYYSFGKYKEFKKKYPWISLEELEKLKVVIRNGELFSKYYIVKFDDLEGNKISLPKSEKNGNPCWTRRVQT